jgi:hypothetical protein
MSSKFAPASIRLRHRLLLLAGSLQVVVLWICGSAGGQRAARGPPAAAVACRPWRARACAAGATVTGCQGDAPDMNTPGDADSSWLAVGNATLLGGALLLLLLLLSWLRPRLPPPPNLKPPLEPRVSRLGQPSASDEEQGTTSEGEQKQELPPMSSEASSTLIATIDVARQAGNELYKVKDWEGAVREYTVGVKACPDLEEESVDDAAREACAVIYTNRSAARFALKQCVAACSQSRHRVSLCV